MIKRSLCILAALAAAATPATAAPKPTRICVLDQSLLLAKANIALAEAQRFQTLRQTAQANFDRDSRALDADARALESFKGDLAPATLAARAQDIARRRADLKSRGEQINRDLAQLDGALTGTIMKVATPVIQKVERENACSMLVSRASLLDLMDPAADISAEVIAQLNALPTAAH